MWLCISEYKSRYSNIYLMKVPLPYAHIKVLSISLSSILYNQIKQPVTSLQASVILFISQYANMIMITPEQKQTPAAQSSEQMYRLLRVPL